MPTCSTNFLLFRYVVDFLVEENDFELVSVPGGSKLTSIKLEHYYFSTLENASAFNIMRGFLFVE